MSRKLTSQSYDSVQEYKIRLKWGERLFRLALMSTLVGTGSYTLLKSQSDDLWGFWAGVAIIAGACFLGFLLHHYSQRRILLTKTELIQRDVDRTTRANWENVRRIEEVWGWGNRTYYVHIPNGIISIPDTIERCDELLTIIQERSGKRIISEWRGAKDTIREDWAAFLRWVRTHPLELLIILLIIGGTAYAATRWLIRERQLYGPSARFGKSVESENWENWGRAK